MIFLNRRVATKISHVSRVVTVFRRQPNWGILEVADVTQIWRYSDTYSKFPSRDSSDVTQAWRHSDTYSRLLLEMVQM